MSSHVLVQTRPWSLRQFSEKFLGWPIVHTGILYLVPLVLLMTTGLVTNEKQDVCCGERIIDLPPVYLVLQDMEYHNDCPVPSCTM